MIGAMTFACIFNGQELFFFFFFFFFFGGGGGGRECCPTKIIYVCAAQVGVVFEPFWFEYGNKI